MECYALDRLADQGGGVVGLVTYWLGGPHPNYYTDNLFENNATFFQWLCRYGETRVRIKKPMVARVASLEDPRSLVRSGLAPDPITLNPGYQPLKVVTPERDGYGRSINATKIDGFPNVIEGDIVGIIPLHKADIFGEQWWHCAVVAKMHAKTGKYGPVVETYY